MTVIRAGIRLVDPLLTRFAADHLTRDPRSLLERAGFDIETVERDRAGVSFRILANRAV